MHSKSTSHPPRCPVYLHPAAAYNPSIIANIQRRTGLLVIVGNAKTPTLQQRLPHAAATGGTAA